MRLILSILVAAVLCPSALAQAPAGAQKREAKYKGKTLAEWVERLQKGGTDIEQQCAAMAIKSFGADAAPAVPALAAMLDDRSPEFLLMVLEILSELGPTAKAATPAVGKLLKQKLSLTPEQRKVEDAKDSFLRPALNEIGMKAASPGTKTLIMVLARIADAKTAVPILVAALAQPELQEASVKALCSLGPAAKDAIPAIRQVISKVTDKPNELFIQPDSRFPQRDPFEPDLGLHKLGRDVLPMLLELLDAPRVYAKRCALVEILKLAPEVSKVLPKLKEMLRDKNPEVRFYTSVALWQINKNQDALSVLASLLDEKNPQLVQAVAMQLGELGPDAMAARPLLKAALEKEWTTPNPLGSLGDNVSVHVREALREAIERIDPKKEK